jgi:cysteine sulfinate desulfinase/cysteine desulfurase-like protein
MNKPVYLDYNATTGKFTTEEEIDQAIQAISEKAFRLLP